MPHIQNTIVQKRQCWSCFRRRIVCDFGQPACKKCQSAGIECPGYSEKKPLKWLEPGKVTSKKRQRGDKRNNKADVVPAASDSLKLFRKQIKEHNRTPSPEEEELIRVFKRKTLANDPYEGPDVEIVPRIDLSDNTSDVVQAVHFFNTRMFPLIEDSYAMQPSRHVMHFPLEALHHVPGAIRHTLVCFAVGYRIHKHEVSEELWSTIYHHRGVAIQSLSRLVTDEDTRSLDITIASVVVFLCSELQQCASTDWRHHLEGIAAMLPLRGGLANVWHNSEHLRSSLILFVLISVASNATSPASTQVTIAPHLELIELMDESYDEILSYSLCPKALFMDIIAINHLRLQFANGLISKSAAELVGFELLMRVESFSPEQFVESRDSFQEDWRLVASIWQSSIALYCIMALQDLSLLQDTLRLQVIKATHGDRLFLNLRRAFLVERLRFFVTWSLVVAGVEAAERGSATQDWVDERLAEGSRSNGSRSALLARATLRRFWKSEQVGWEKCFSKPCAFVI